MLAIIAAIVSLIGWGTGDIFTTLASRKMGSFSASFYGYFFGLIISTVYLPLAINSFHLLTLPIVLLTVILSIVQLLSFFSYNEALRVGNSSLVGTIAGSFTAIVAVLSVVFLKEHLSQQQILSIGIIFGGLILASLNFQSIHSIKTFLNRGTVFALVAMTGWAIYYTFIKIPVNQSGFFLPAYISTLIGTVCFFVFGFKKIKRPELRIKSGTPAAFASGLLLTIGGFAFNLGINNGLSSIVAPIAGAYPALFALIAYFVFKDPITRQQKIGMVITLLGIIALAYFGK